jgi:hypothetical protein
MNALGEIAGAEWPFMRRMAVLDAVATGSVGAVVSRSGVYARSPPRPGPAAVIAGITAMGRIAPLVGVHDADAVVTRDEDMYLTRD